MSEKRDDMPTETTSTEDKLSVWLFVAVSIIIVAIFSILSYFVYCQAKGYRDGIGALLDSPFNSVAFTAYMGVWDVGFAKISSIFVSFLTILIGALYVLRTTRSQFRVSGESANAFKANLSTTSPGLVICAIGAILAIVSLYKQVHISYEEAEHHSRFSIHPKTHDAQRLTK